jgi:antitoxin YefM
MLQGLPSAPQPARAVQETLYLVSIPGMRESIIEGMATPAEELDGELRW